MEKTLQQLRKDHDEWTQEWSESPFYEEQADFFENVIFQLDDLQLNSVLCMSLGNFSDTEEEGLTRDYNITDTRTKVVHPRLHELVLHEGFIKILRKKFKIPNNKIYFQDPAFTDVEIMFLQSLGYNVINHPEAEDVISPHTFLCGHLVYKWVTRGLFERAIPGLALMSPFHIRDFWWWKDCGDQDIPSTKRCLDRFLVSHDSRKMGPIIPEVSSPSGGVTIASRMNHTLDNLVLYWAPNDPVERKPVQWKTAMEYYLRPGPGCPKAGLAPAYRNYSAARISMELESEAKDSAKAEAEFFEPMGG